MPSIAHGNALREGKDSQLRVMEMLVMGVMGLSLQVVEGWSPALERHQQGMCRSGLSVCNWYVTRIYPRLTFILGRIALICQNRLFFTSFFRNFVRIDRISLYEGGLGDWGFSGLRIRNRTQFRILLWNAFKEHPTMCHQPYYGSSSGAKVIISFERAKSIRLFFFWTRHL